MIRRKDLGLTQQEIATAAGVTTRTVQLWEAGTHVPSLSFSQVAALCDLLKCSVKDLAKDFEPQGNKGS
ncbi:MAG: helix-turn-helix transcriptional regulator [Cyanobacteria bacterium J06648_10]